jgi:DNA ligase (NAD+)
MNLEQQVKHLDKHYRDGNALVSDKQFDQLEKQLLSINPDSDYFTNKNALPLPSLEKDPIEDFLDGLDQEEQIVIEPKIDGCAVAIEYRNGKIHQAITRKGKDITQKMIRIRTVPLTVPTNDTMQIRGELYVDFGYGQIKPGDGAKSQRIAAGYLRSKSFDPNPMLKFSAFQIINAEIDQWDALHLLYKMGFKRHNCSLIAVKTFKIDIVHWFKTELPTDGIVVKINDYKLQQTRPDDWQIAIKHYG